MLNWVQSGVCPNYLIPMDNLFHGKLNESQRLNLEKILKKLLDTGFACLREVKSDDICKYVRSRSDEKLCERLQAKSKEVYKQTLIQLDIRWTSDARARYDTAITEHYNYYPVFGDAYTIVKFLWLMLDRIQQVSMVTEHNAEETKSSLSILIPFVYECLASNISVIAFDHSNVQVKHFFLFGSFICFLKGDLLGRLKFISVMYAIGLYTDSELFLNRENEGDITLNTSNCDCRKIKSTVQYRKTKTILDAIPSQSNRCTCISFFQSELPIIPDAMVYEMFRYLGINIQHQGQLNYSNIWLFNAVVDYNIYFFLLKYLIKRKLGRLQESNHAASTIRSLLVEKHVIHSDVACNIMARIYNNQLMTPMALFFLLWS